MKIAHFFSDPKFIHGAHQSFEVVAPGASTYFYDATGEITESLKSVNPVKFKMNNEGISQLAEFDVWVIHGLSGNRLKILNHKKKHQKVVWIGMGYDYYDLIFPNQMDLFEEATAAEAPIASRPTLSFGLLLSFEGVKGIARKLGLLRLRKLQKMRKMRKIDVFCPVLNSEYDMVVNRYRLLFPKFMDWNYGSSSELLTNFMANSKVVVADKNNVLIGNSATATNNHLEVFQLISSSKLFPSSDFIVPLAYGHDEYKKWLNRRGEQLLGQRYKPLDEFVPVQEYLALITTCSHVIMNHRRQQAGANVAFALASGARVLMNPSSPLYQEWLNRGAIINSIEELKTSPDTVKKPLTEDEILINRNVIAEYIHPIVFENKTRALLTELGFNSSL